MALNPSSSSGKPAPTPATDLAAFMETMTAALDASTSAAAKFPEKSDISFHRSLDRKFAKGMDATSDHLLKLTDQLLQLAVDNAQQKAKEKGKRTKPRRKVADEDDVTDSFHSSVVEVVDGLLEDADSNLDELNGQKKKAQIDVQQWAAVRAGEKLPGPFNSNKTLPAELHHAAHLGKPQLSFRDKVDNSPHLPPWRPTLHEKPHAMVPMGYIVAADEDAPPPGPDAPGLDGVLRSDRVERARMHPYYYETRHLPYPTSLFTASTPQPPKSFEDTPFEFVTTPEQLAALTEVLKDAKEVAVDLEHHNTRSYYGFTCLMQISTREHDWVVDTIALRAELRDHKLGGVFSDPSVVKVFHGAESDILWLQRDFDIYVVNLFDTFHAAKVLQFPSFSLASLLHLYCDFTADKKYQMADWRIRPIPDEMMYYARADTHFLLYVYDSLRNALLQRSSRTPSPAVDAEGDGASTPKPNPQDAIRQVLYKSAETALQLYARDGYDRERGFGYNGWYSLSRKLGKKDIIQTQVGWVFKAVHEWRDNLARELDESPHFVLANHVVIQLSHLRPNNVAILTRTISRQSQHAQERVDELIKVIVDASAAYDAHVANGGDVEMAPASTKNASKAASGSATPAVASNGAAPSKKRAKANTLPVDVWSDIINGKVATAQAGAATSSLFGKTLGDAPKASSSTPAAAATSSLFGNTLTSKKGKSKARPARGLSPGFVAAQAQIHTVLQPPQPEPAAAGDASMPTEPENVPFIPAAKRTTARSEQQGSAASTKIDKPTLSRTTSGDTPKAGATPAATANEDGIVSVKKKKKAKKNKGSKSATSEPTSARSSARASPSASTPVPVADADAAAPKKKTKVKAADIPEFDYAAEPNLLDNPTSKEPKPKKKGKKDKKPKKALGPDTSAFPRAPADPTQPKSGSRSGTFMG